jgi:hypothetical protein
MKEEKCANYERDNVVEEFKKVISTDKTFLYEMEHNIADALMNDYWKNIFFGTYPEFNSEDYKRKIEEICEYYKKAEFKTDKYYKDKEKLDTIYIHYNSDKIVCNSQEISNGNGSVNKWVVIETLPCQDPIVESVRQKLLDRSNVGIKKYNTTLESNNKDNYLKHAQEEAMDLSNYLEKIMQQEKEITELVTKYPNNMELGEKIRQIYGKV